VSELKSCSFCEENIEEDNNKITMRGCLCRVWPEKEYAIAVIINENVIKNISKLPFERFLGKQVRVSIEVIE